MEVEVKCQYNYDIRLVMKFKTKDFSLVKTMVEHEIKGWRYSFDEATQIGGFEDNKAEFDKILSTTKKVLADNEKSIREVIKKGRTGMCEGTPYYKVDHIDKLFKVELLKH